MHEMSLCEGIRRIIENQAKKDGFTQVKRVLIALGERSGVSEEALSFCFPLAVRGSVADGAELVFKRTEDAILKVIEMDVL